MNTPHKHAAVIRAWADGATVQVASANKPTEWVDTAFPAFHTTMLYRVKPVPHKWQKEMDAFKEGKVIQWLKKDSPLPRDREWHDIAPGTLVTWNIATGWEYRVKPEPVVFFDYVHYSDNGRERNGSFTQRPDDNVKYIFEDGKLVKAEVL